MQGGYSGELFASYSAVEARREWEIEMIKERLGKNEMVETSVCRVERVSGSSAVVRFGLKRGKLLYLFKYPSHDVEREKHRNVITRARFIKHALEAHGYRLIPWDFKKGKPPTFWEESEQGNTMEEEDDDLYGPSETAAPVAPKQEDPKDDESDDEDQPMDEGAESGDDDDDEDSDSDSDLEIIIDKPQAAPRPPPPPQESKAIKIEAPPQPTPSTAALKASSSAPGHANKLSSDKPGTAYPAVRTADIDLNADPIYPPVGKPISQIDIDADLAESTKPWRLPGADQSDYFNYSFDEFTWEMYRQRQATMAATLSAQKAETAQFQQMFGMAGGPGMSAAPAAPTGAPTGPSAQTGMGGGVGAGVGGDMGMPTPDQMQMMAQQMQAQGMDVANMDFGMFAQMMGGMGGMGGGFGGPPQQQQQQGGGGGGYGGQQGGGGGGGGGGRGRGRGRGW